MIEQAINGLDLLCMIESGAKFLSGEVERINALNVFPVPDGDTGTNMKMTIDGGASLGSKLNENNIGALSKSIARAMVLSARGNSGVILSQFFKGLSLGLENKATANVMEFANAMKEGTKKAYSVVSNPTEGTMLTVMREAGDNTYAVIDDNTTIEEYFIKYINYAKESLKRTPDLLPVLKKAGVIDSGGAGFLLVVEGMLKAVRGEEITLDYNTNTKCVDVSNFNRDSELTYGYCTEFILQLQSSKVNPDTFDLNIINDFLNSIGDSIVSFKDDDIIKVHVHTFDPGVVLTECRKYGEFLTLKIENMNVGHTENIEVVKEAQVETLEHKNYAIVSVASGSGIINTFKEMGVDEVVEGGQTMNTSTQDFIDAFNKIDADNILVYPNNSNIIMAAKMAQETYDKANVYVIPTKTIAEGYSAISMLNCDSDNIDEILEEQNMAIESVNTLEVTYSIRDTNINNIDIKKGDYICIYNNDLIASDPNRLEALKKAFAKIDGIEDMQVLTLLCGSDVSMDEVNDISEYIQKLNSYLEIYPIEGNQDIYSYIIGIE